MAGSGVTAMVSLCWSAAPLMGFSLTMSSVYPTKRDQAKTGREIGQQTTTTAH